MYLSKFVNSSTGKVLMSVILGIGLATFFRAVCTGSNCNMLVAPPIEEIEGQIYKFDDQCYKIDKTAVKCNPKKTIITM
jgi:hypothetical protein